MPAQECLTCGAPAEVEPRLFDPNTEDWTCPKCGTTGVVSMASHDTFADFWTVYPRKVAKAAALRAWRKLKPSEALAGAILTGLERQRCEREVALNRGEWVPEWPYPATWINSRRWEDELAPVKPMRGAEPAYSGSDWADDCRHDPPCTSRRQHEVKVEREAGRRC